MADFDISGTASTVFGIAGMGIGLGLLAHTSRAVVDTMYQPRRQYQQPRRVVQRKQVVYQPRVVRNRPYPSFYNYKQRYW